MTWIDIMGLVAACCTTAAFVPQAIRTLRTRQTRDLSLATYLLMVVGISLWFTYGLLQGDVPLMAANAVTFVLTASILVTKLRYG